MFQPWTSNIPSLWISIHVLALGFLAGRWRFVFGEVPSIDPIWYTMWDNKCSPAKTTNYRSSLCSWTLILIYPCVYINWNMGMYFLGWFKALNGTEVEAPRIIPPNHTPSHTPASNPPVKGFFLVSRKHIIYIICNILYIYICIYNIYIYVYIYYHIYIYILSYIYIICIYIYIMIYIYINTYLGAGWCWVLQGAAGGVWGACAAIHALSHVGQDACDACHVPRPWVLLAGCCWVLLGGAGCCWMLLGAVGCWLGCGVRALQSTLCPNLGQDACDACHVPFPWVLLAGCWVLLGAAG